MPKKTHPIIFMCWATSLCLVMLLSSSFKEVIHFLNAITATASRTLIVVAKPFKDVVCMPTMATHHAEVACSFDCNMANWTAEGETAAVSTLRSLGWLATMDTVSRELHTLVSWWLGLQILQNHCPLLEEAPAVKDVCIGPAQFIILLAPAAIEKLGWVPVQGVCGLENRKVHLLRWSRNLR